ncbi:TSUP family transporter [Halococcus morrhuae DSM 1307]|uniref:TSUP family transporter n=1 Tax=Halococcus morrhuae TaxID=2250 RepID=UPI003F862EA1
MYAISLWALTAFVVPRFTPESADSVGLFVPVIVVSAFVFETLDSASGMGFGATIGALLFVLGYDPLAVTPVLLLSEAATGIVSGLFHNEFQNVEFGLDNDSAVEATRVLGIIVGVGVLAVVVSVVLTYFQFSIPDVYIKSYVGVVVLLIASVTIVQKYVGSATDYRPRLLIGFAVFAGLNKGIAGSGYGPVITLGEIISGVYEKSATAITSAAEGVVSLAGIATFFGITAAGVEINLMLLPSVFAGGFLAAILAPYTVRTLPNRALQYLVPGYALVLVAILFAQVL